jgi:ketosteroid isomerase-like protein
MPLIAAVESFIDCINRGDVDGLGQLMSEDHRLVVLDEEPVVGRDHNIDAWRGYFSSFPAYVIHPRALAAGEGRVAVLGTTTGSHLCLADEEEARLTVIWLAGVEDGKVRSWQVIEDTLPARRGLGLPTVG